MNITRGYIQTGVCLLLLLVLPTGCATNKKTSQLHFEKEREKILKNVKEMLRTFEKKQEKKLSSIEEQVEKNQKKLETLEQKTKQARNTALHTHKSLLQKLNKLKTHLNDHRLFGKDLQITTHKSSNRNAPDDQSSIQQQLRRLEQRYAQQKKQ